MHIQQLKQLAVHIRSIPHFRFPPGFDWEDMGYQEYVNYPTIQYPEFFSFEYPYAILHPKSGTPYAILHSKGEDITIGDLAAHGLVMRHCFTGVVNDTLEQLFLHIDAFGEAFDFPKKKGSNLPSPLAMELAYPSVKRLHRITSEDMAIAIEKCIEGARVIYTLWDHVFDRCPIREEAHAGYDVETRKLYERFDSLPSYLKGGKEER